MSTSTQQYQLIYTFNGYEGEIIGEVIIMVMAYSEGHAIERAERILSGKLSPRLKSIKLVP